MTAALTAYRSADPYGASLASESEAERLIADQEADIAEFRAYLQAAIRCANMLGFSLGWPNKHHTRETALALLRELLPDQTAAEMSERAWEIVTENAA